MRRYSSAMRPNFKSQRPTKRRSIFSIFKRRKHALAERHTVLHQEYSGAFIPRRQRMIQASGTRLNLWPLIRKLLLPALLLAWIGLMLFLPYFRINNVSYYGLNIVKKDTIDTYVRGNVLASRFSWWPANNYFLLGKSRLESNLKKQFSFATVTVKKVFPNRIIVDVTEKISSIIYDDGQNYYLLDQSGQIIKLLRAVGESERKTVLISAPIVAISSTTPTFTASSTAESPSSTTRIDHTPNSASIHQEFGKFPVLYDKRDEPLNAASSSGMVLFNPIAVKGILDWQTLVEERGIGRIKYFTSQQTTPGITTVINEPWTLQFDPTGDLEQQARNIELVLRENRPTQYIDVRFGDRVYWK